MTVLIALVLALPMELAGAIALTVAGLAVEAWRATNPERNAR